MLRFSPQYYKRFYYEANGSETFKFPSGNLFSAMKLLLKLEANIVTSTSSNAPDFQIFNAIDNIQLIRDSKEIVWSLSGQAAALLFTYVKGKAAANNAAIAGTVANNVQGQHFLHCPFYPLDAIKPWDFSCDTRAHDYELKIKWKNLTAAGTLFGTIGSSITVTDSENYLELQLDVITPMNSPIDNKPDGLASVAPLIVGYREDKLAVTANNNKFQIDIPDFQKYRNIVLFTTHVANTLQEVGENDIIQESIKLYDTQKKFYQDVRVDMLREDTSQRWGLGSTLPNGAYDMNILAFGSALDVLVSNNVTNLFLDLDVVKQTNNTFIRPIYVTQEEQGV